MRHCVELSVDECADLIIEVRRPERAEITFPPGEWATAGPVIVLGWGWLIRALVTHTLWCSFGHHGWLSFQRGGNRPGFSVRNENKENCIFMSGRIRPLTWRRNVSTTDRECYSRWWILFSWHVSTLALHDAGGESCSYMMQMRNICMWQW